MRPVGSGGGTDEIYRTTSPSGEERAGSGDDADSRIADAPMCTESSAGGLLPDELAVARRACSDTLAE